MADNKSVSESDIRNVTKAMMSTVMKTVSAGQKTVISPTEIRNITTQIVADAESGSIRRFEMALDKAKKVIDDLDIDLKDFNTSLAKRIKELDDQTLQSQKEVETLRKENVVAEVRANKQGKEFAYETHILSKKEIETRTALLIQRKKQFEEDETRILKEREKLLSSEELLLPEQKKQIIADQERLDKEKELIQKEETTLNPLKDDDDKGMGPTSSFYEELKAPFIAVGDAFMSLKDIGKDMVRIFKFFSEGGLTKGLKSFKNGVMALGRFFMSTKVLIGLAIVGVIAAVVFFKDKLISIGKFIIGIPEMIANGIKKVWIMISDFFKSAINSVIKLINKIPGINIPLLETSKMKEEKEESERQERIKQGAKEFSGDIETNTESGFRDKGTYLEPKFEQTRGFSDDAGMMEQSNIVYDKGSKSAILMNRQVVGDQLKGAGATGTGDASTAKTLYQESKQASMYDTGEVPPVIVNNSNQSSVNSSGSTTVGFINNKNADDTFTNLNYVMP